jgi:hypothetical protein
MFNEIHNSHSFERMSLLQYVYLYVRYTDDIVIEEMHAPQNQVWIVITKPSIYGIK